MENINKNQNMESTKKGKKCIGTGEIGSPRPGAEGIQRVPSASSSDDRRREQVRDQACSSSQATVSREEIGRGNTTEPFISEESSGEEPPRQRTTNASKRRRRAISSTPSSESEATMGPDNETGNRRKETKSRAHPPARRSKRLRTKEERLAEIRHAPSASLAVNILEVADSIEQMAATAGNLKGTYVRRLRDDADKARANATELAKRTTVAGAQTALEQENLQLRARLEKAEEEIEVLRKERYQPGRVEEEKGSRTSETPENQRQTREAICPGPLKQAGPGISIRAK